jgi:serine/threonine protein kinase
VFNAAKLDPEETLDVKVLKKIGSGSQSEVFKVRIKGQTGRYVDKMKKILNNDELAATFMQHMFSEFYLGKNLQHPSLIEYKYFMRRYDPDTKEHEFHILMDLMEGGDLEKYLEEQGRPYLIDNVKEIGAQIIAGVKFLHENDVIHQDLKPQNILFNSEFTQVKLIDLGISHRQLDSTRQTKAAEKGTPRYMSPEQVDGKLSFKIDIWAFGCVMLQFATGMMPFHKLTNDMAVGLEIYRGLTPLDYIYKHAKLEELDMIEDNEEFKGLLQLCFNRNYTKRPTAAELLEHSFFADNND